MRIKEAVALPADIERLRAQLAVERERRQEAERRLAVQATRASENNTALARNNLRLQEQLARLRGEADVAAHEAGCQRAAAAARERTATLEINRLRVQLQHAAAEQRGLQEQLAAKQGIIAYLEGKLAEVQRSSKRPDVGNDAVAEAAGSGNARGAVLRLVEEITVEAADIDEPASSSAASDAGSFTAVQAGLVDEEVEEAAQQQQQQRQRRQQGEHEQGELEVEQGQEQEQSSESGSVVAAGCVDGNVERGANRTAGAGALREQASPHRQLHTHAAEHSARADRSGASAEQQAGAGMGASGRAAAGGAGAAAGGAAWAAWAAAEAAGEAAGAGGGASAAMVVTPMRAAPQLESSREPGTVLRSSLRNRSSISYAEPSLRSKLRQGDPFTFGTAEAAATAAEGAGGRRPRARTKPRPQFAVSSRAAGGAADGSTALQTVTDGVAGRSG